MELKGSIKERPALDLLTSMAQEKSSGVLRLSKGREGLQVHWSHGKIVQVTPDPITKQGNFGQMMVEVGQITPSQLEQTLAQQRRSLAPLGEILVKVFHCDRQRVAQVLQVQALERLYTTFFWKSGQYTFASQVVAPPREHFAPIDMDELSRHANDVRKVWSKARKRFHSPNLEVEAIGPSLPSDIQLGELEHRVFQLLTTGMYRFRELSIVSGLGQFATGYALQTLLEHQLIIVRNPQRQGIQWSRLLLGGSLTEFAVWLLVMAMLVGAGTYLLAFAPYSPLHLLRPSRRLHLVAPGWEEKVESWRQQRIRSALELYRLEYGAYPKALSSLSQKGWIATGQLRSLSGKVFDYKRFTPHRYRLLRPLP